MQCTGMQGTVTPAIPDITVSTDQRGLHAQVAMGEMSKARQGRQNRREDQQSAARAEERPAAKTGNPAKPLTRPHSPALRTAKRRRTDAGQEAAAAVRCASSSAY